METQGFSKPLAIGSSPIVGCVFLSFFLFFHGLSVHLVQPKGGLLDVAGTCGIMSTSSGSNLRSEECNLLLSSLLLAS